MKILVVPVTNGGAEALGEGVEVECLSKNSIWELKVKVMNVTGAVESPWFPPATCIHSTNDINAPALNDVESLFEHGIRGDTTLYMSVKADAKGRRGKGAPQLKKYLASKKKAAPVPEISFALGRGLYQAVSTYETEFFIYAVDRTGYFLPTENIPWHIALELFDESGLHFAGIEINLEHDKVHRACHARFTPNRPGNYLLAIKMGADADSAIKIAGSPFPVTVIDVDDRAETVLTELCHEPKWSQEIAQVLVRLSGSPESHRRIFEEITFDAVMAMTEYQEPRIQDNMATVLINLLKVDQNKVRMVKEGGIQLVTRLAAMPSVAEKEDVMVFMGRVIALLAEQDLVREQVVTEIGMDPVIFLLKQGNDCRRAAARALQYISADDAHKGLVIRSGVVPLLWELLSSNDLFLTRFVIRVLANLSDNIGSFEVDEKSFKLVVDMMLTTDSQLNVHAAHILSNLTLKQEFVSKVLGILEMICKVVTSAQIRFEWEFDSVVAVIQEEDDDDLEPQMGDTTYELNFYFMKILANLLSRGTEATNPRAKQLISDNDVLKILVHFARSFDRHVQAEACRALAVFCESDSEIAEITAVGGVMAPLITLISSQQLSPEGIIHVIKAMAGALTSKAGIITVIPETGQDTILRLLTHPNAEVATNAAIVLAGIVKNDEYKSRIVARGGKVFLLKLMTLVKDGVVEVQRNIDSGEVKLLEIIGKGVSGVVWKGIWQKRECAIKRFNEDNLAFDEEEFKSELAMMSVLRHDNIVHSWGGCTVKGDLFILAEMFNKGSLADTILNKTIDIERPVCLQMLVDTAAGMQYLHQLGIIHRDLKAGNLLLSDAWVVCVTDFGVSKMMSHEMTKAAGTPMYMSPEILNGAAYATSADVYSYAFVIWELLARELPYGSMNPWEITKEVLDNDLRPPNHNDPLDDLMGLCWDKDPEKRPTFKMILTYLKTLQRAYNQRGEQGFAEAAKAKRHLLTDFPKESSSMDLDKELAEYHAASAVTGGGLTMSTGGSVASPIQSPKVPKKGDSQKGGFLNKLTMRKKK